MNKNIEKTLEALAAKFEILGTDSPKENQLSVDFLSRDIHGALAYLKSQGFSQLSMLSCVDWIDEGQFQLVYLIFNWEQGVRMQIRTRIERGNPKFLTVTDIYPGAQYYERDVHEFFGVEFEGNEMSYKQLFLENWDDIPPMRKDFDPLAYSERKYPAREYKKDFSTKEGEGR